MSAKDFDVIVIGEGMSGLTAAASLVQQGLLVSTFEQTLFGGLVLNINQLRPGLDRNTGSGADLSALLMEKNFEAGVISVQEPGSTWLLLAAAIALDKYCWLVGRV